jgi:hypothetical protein
LKSHRKKVARRRLKHFYAILAVHPRTLEPGTRITYDFTSPKVHRREYYFASLHIKLVTFTLFLCSSAECSSPLGTTINYVRRTASGAAGSGFGTTIKHVPPLCSSAECFSPDAAASRPSRRHRQKSKHRPEHHNQV